MAAEDQSKLIPKESSPSYPMEVDTMREPRIGIQFTKVAVRSVRTLQERSLGDLGARTLPTHLIFIVTPIRN